MSTESNAGGGIGLPAVLFVVFLVLRLTGTIDWSWWWVTAPLWIPWAAGLIALPVWLIWRARRSPWQRW